MAGQEGAHFWKLSWVEMELYLDTFLGGNEVITFSTESNAFCDDLVNGTYRWVILINLLVCVEAPVLLEISHLEHVT